MKSITPQQREQARRTADKYLPRADEPKPKPTIIKEHAGWIVANTPTHVIISNRDGSVTVPLSQGVALGNAVVKATRWSLAAAIVANPRSKR